MTPDFIGNLTVVTILMVVLLTIIGAGASVNWILKGMKMGWIVFGIVVLVIAFVIWFGLDANI